MLRPILRYSHVRDAYVLRGVGSSVGPVLRVDRRGAHTGREYAGRERRSRRVTVPERRSAPVA